MAPRQVYTVGNSGTSLLMWAATGNHGRQWTYADVILSNIAPFRVTFQAEVGGDMWTDIALDDIAYTEECVAEGKEVSCADPIFQPTVSPPLLFFSTFSVHHLALFPFELCCSLTILMMAVLEINTNRSTQD